MKLTLPDVALELRECATLEDYHQCLELQRRVWQVSETDVVPTHIFLVTGLIGGQTLGVFTEQGRLVAFSHMLPLVAGPRHDYHSHMLAVAPELQNRGVGRELKLRQRQRALGEGVARIVWTFDPLEARNAYFNLVKLGAVTRSYKVDFYGHSTSAMHQGLATDRLYVEWFVASPRVEQCLAGSSPAGPAIEATIEIPGNVQALKQNDLGLARDWQLQIREQFQGLFDQGLWCVGLQRKAGAGRSEYLFAADWK